MRCFIIGGETESIPIMRMATGPRGLPPSWPTMPIRSAKASKLRERCGLAGCAILPRWRPGRMRPSLPLPRARMGQPQIVGYNKAAMVFLMLRDLLGRDTFDRALHTFWQRAALPHCILGGFGARLRVSLRPGSSCVLRPVALTRRRTRSGACGSETCEVRFW